MENKDKERDKKRAEYEEGLKKTLIPVAFGVLAGVICFLLFVSTPYLVSVNGGLKADLDKGLIPDNLTDMFEAKGTPLSENVAITKKGNDKWWINEEKYLFSTNVGLEEDLNNNTISESLKNVFKTEGFPLSENVVLKKNEDKWMITGEEKKNTYFIRKEDEKLDIYEEKKNTYFIRKEDEKLDIYTNFKSRDWLIIAIIMIFVQKFVYRSLHIPMEGVKDWIYLAFMTLFCWFVAYTLMLNMYI